MIEEFSFTTKYFDKEVKEANNQLAALSWARLTWEQRVTNLNRVAVFTDVTPHDKVITYYPGSFSSKRKPIVCETLSQMQF